MRRGININNPISIPNERYIAEATSQVKSNLGTNTPKQEKVVNSDDELLKMIIPRYKENKSEMDRLKKLCDEDNEIIKNIFIKNNWNKYSVGNTQANVNSYDKASFIEEALISKIKELGIVGIIKQKDYVDLTALENAIIDKKIDAATLVNCQEIKSITNLRIGKVKEVGE